MLSKAETVEDAIALLTPLVSSNWGANYALADRTGAAAVVEKAGALQGIRRTQGPCLWCTNHALSPEMIPYRINNAAALQESSERYDAIDRLTRDHPLSAELARHVVAYAGRPGALCRYGDDDPLRYETEFACILFPATGRADFCFSHPDRDPWRRFSLTPGTQEKADEK